MGLVGRSMMMMKMMMMDDGRWSLCLARCVRRTFCKSLLKHVESTQKNGKWSEDHFAWPVACSRLVRNSSAGLRAVFVDQNRGTDETTVSHSPLSTICGRYNLQCHSLAPAPCYCCYPSCHKLLASPLPPHLIR